MPRFKTAYEVNDRVTADPVGLSRAKQSMKEECDINTIMDKYRANGVVNHLNKHEGDYGEFAEFDFHAAMNTIVAANETFETVPADIRSRFGNDPGAFLEFVTNDENFREMVDMGLARSKPEETQNMPRNPAPETPAEAPQDS